MVLQGLFKLIWHFDVFIHGPSIKIVCQGIWYTLLQRDVFLLVYYERMLGGGDIKIHLIEFWDFGNLLFNRERFHTNPNKVKPCFLPWDWCGRINKRKFKTIGLLRKDQPICDVRGDGKSMVSMYMDYQVDWCQNSCRAFMGSTTK